MHSQQGEKAIVLHNIRVCLGWVHLVRNDFLSCTIFPPAFAWNKGIFGKKGQHITGSANYRDALEIYEKVLDGEIDLFEDWITTVKYPFLSTNSLHILQPNF